MDQQGSIKRNISVAGEGGRVWVYFRTCLPTMHPSHTTVPRVPLIFLQAHPLHGIVIWRINLWTAAFPGLYEGIQYKNRND